MSTWSGDSPCRKGGTPLELGRQIKKYRTEAALLQEALAEHIYVTRQTISNWENDKSYPDIHSLLLLSDLFHISLDQLIKGDIKQMKQEIKHSEIQKFNHYENLFAVSFLITIVSAVPLAVFLKFYGVLLSALQFAVCMYLALKVEKCKKSNDIQTYKEIVAFSEGRHLDAIEKNQEIGKRPYQKAFLVLGCAGITLVLSLVLLWILKPFL